jgi:hypothetical protein
MGPSSRHPNSLLLHNPILAALLFNLGRHEITIERHRRVEPRLGSDFRCSIQMEWCLSSIGKGVLTTISNCGAVYSIRMLLPSNVTLASANCCSCLSHAPFFKRNVWIEARKKCFWPKHSGWTWLPHALIEDMVDASNILP